MATVAVDFDGVIHAYSKGWHDGTIYDEPMPGAIDAVRQLMEIYAVFVHTMRNPVQVATWLGGRGFSVVLDVDEPEHPPRRFWENRGALLVTNRKLPAVAYIDDRGIRFESWDQALFDLHRFEG